MKNTRKGSIELCESEYGDACDPYKQTSHAPGKKRVVMQSKYI